MQRMRVYNINKKAHYNSRPKCSLQNTEALPVTPLPAKVAVAKTHTEKPQRREKKKEQKTEKKNEKQKKKNEKQNKKQEPDRKKRNTLQAPAYSQHIERHTPQQPWHTAAQLAEHTVCTALNPRETTMTAWLL